MQAPIIFTVKASIKNREWKNYKTKNLLQDITIYFFYIVVWVFQKGTNY